MIYKEIKKNIFEFDKDKYYFAHCIASDCGMGAGIAVDFNKKFHLKEKLLGCPDEIRQFPKVLLVNNVFNLITKKKSSGKPTYQSIEKTIEVMATMVKNRDIKYLVMPKIGCGLDKLQWGIVREMIIKYFKDIDVEITVCHL